MDSRRTADPDIPYPDLRFERAELMRSRMKRTASWPADFGSQSIGRTYDRNRQTDVAKESACQGANGMDPALAAEWNLERQLR
jgi:hypothetical protein